MVLCTLQLPPPLQTPDKPNSSNCHTLYPLLQPHMSGIIQRVAHHCHWWLPSLGTSLLTSLPMWGVVSSCQRSVACWAHLVLYCWFYSSFTPFWLLRMGKDFPPQLSSTGYYVHQWSCQFARCCKWIWWIQFLWHSSQPAHVRLDNCFYCP